MGSDQQGRKQSAIVFGGSGFVGSHVADELSRQNYAVTIFDMKPSPWLPRNQRMITGDLLDKDAVIKACKGFDFVYNFAGMADINEAKDDPESTIRLNIVGNFNVLEGARQANAKRFIYASTVYVCGESGSFYRASKQACESYVELYSERFGLPFTILRYGSLYGRRADARNSIYSFVHSALTKGEIVYFGSGTELREYIHVEDAAKASVMVLECDEYKNQHLVLTGNQSMRVADVMEMIAEMLGNKVKVICNKSGHEGHYKITPYAYKNRIGKKLVMNPFVDIGQGLLDCVHEIDEKLQHYGDATLQEHGHDCSL